MSKWTDTCKRELDLHQSRHKQRTQKEYSETLLQLTAVCDVSLRRGQMGWVLTVKPTISPTVKHVIKGLGSSSVVSDC